MNQSDKIRQLRKQGGLSQTKMAELIGISQAAYAKIENGDTKSISIEIGKGISKALDISFNELFDIEGTPQDQTEILITEIVSLKNQIEEKDERIEMLKNNIAHIRHGFTSQINGNCFWQVDKIDRKLTEVINEEEKIVLLTEREKIIENYKKEKEFNLNMGLLTKQDFEANYEYLSWLYENMKDREILK